MHKGFGAIVVAALMVTGCARVPADGFGGERTVFNNPYAPPEIDQTGIGPKCSEEVIRDERCRLDSLIYPGQGRFARDANGNLVRLTRSERRLLRDRSEAIRSRIDVLESLENGTAIPPGSPALKDLPPPPPPAPKVGDTIPARNAPKR
ncbi:hypothetical protein [uncultured Erythrobacter sp.]|uniref:hypothetical protein n=1 Tax=uncultured Erythrobacter sp. TaxID=263913 RepID=UPI002632A76B|nr:hypothetical protein [uncultured Erythrobacter sp.]